MDSSSIKFITTFAKNMWKPKDKKDPNQIKIKVDPLKKVKLTPEELEEDWKANRGTGPHRNPKEKRKQNPFKSDSGWD